MADTFPQEAVEKAALALARSEEVTLADPFRSGRLALEGSGVGEVVQNLANALDAIDRISKTDDVAAEIARSALSELRKEGWDV